MRVFVTSIVSKWYESRPAGAERAGTANPPTVSRLRDHPGVAMRSVFAFALLSACSLPAVAQTAGSMLLQAGRSEEHTSELQSLMRNSYAVFCLKNNKNN